MFLYGEKSIILHLRLHLRYIISQREGYLLNSEALCCTMLLDKWWALRASKYVLGLVKPSGKPWLMGIEIWVAGVLSGVPMKQGKCHEDRKYLVCRKLVSSWQIHQAVASVMKTGVFSVSITQPVWFTVNHSCCGSSFSAAATADTETGRWQEMYFRCFSVIWIPEMQSQALLWTKFKDSCTSYWWLLLKEYFY